MICENCNLPMVEAPTGNGTVATMCLTCGTIEEIIPPLPTGIREGMVKENMTKE